MSDRTKGRTTLRVSEPWTAEEIPIPVDIYMHPDRSDMSGGWLLQVRIERDGTEIPFTGTVAWEDAATSLARITFADGDIDVGADRDVSFYEIVVWASSGDQRIASALIKAEVHAHIGTAPTI